LLFLKIKH